MVQPMLLALFTFGHKTVLCTAGGFVENKDPGLTVQTFGDGAFLLVAAAQFADRSADRSGLDPETVEVACGSFIFLVFPDERSAAVFPERDQSYIFREAESLDSPGILTVLGEICDPGTDRLDGRRRIYFGTVDPDGSGPGK